MDVKSVLCFLTAFSVVAVSDAHRYLEKDCTFPFTYRGVKYDRCTNVGMKDPNVFWCSLDSTYKGYVAYCTDLWKHKFKDQMEDLKKNLSGQQENFEIVKNATMHVVQHVENMRQWVKMAASNTTKVVQDVMMSKFASMRKDITKYGKKLNDRISKLQVKIKAFNKKLEKFQKVRLGEYHKRLLRIMTSLESTFRRMYLLRRQHHDNEKTIFKRLIIINKRLKIVELKLKKLLPLIAEREPPSTTTIKSKPVTASPIKHLTTSSSAESTSESASLFDATLSPVNATSV